LGKRITPRPWDGKQRKKGKKKKPKNPMVLGHEKKPPRKQEGENHQRGLVYKLDNRPQQLAPRLGLPSHNRFTKNPKWGGGEGEKAPNPVGNQPGSNEDHRNHS